jgi:hypothetical protein
MTLTDRSSGLAQMTALVGSRNSGRHVSRETTTQMVFDARLRLI